MSYKGYRGAGGFRLWLSEQLSFEVYLKVCTMDICDFLWWIIQSYVLRRTFSELLQYIVQIIAFDRGASNSRPHSGQTPKLWTAKFGLKKLQTSFIVWRTTYSDIQNSLNVCHRCDRQTDGQMDRTTVATGCIAKKWWRIPGRDGKSSFDDRRIPTTALTLWYTAFNVSSSFAYSW